MVWEQKYNHTKWVRHYTHVKGNLHFPCVSSFGHSSYFTPFFLMLCLFMLKKIRTGFVSKLLCQWTGEEEEVAHKLVHIRNFPSGGRQWQDQNGISLWTSLLLDDLKSVVKCLMHLLECIESATFLWFSSLHLKQPHLCITRDNSSEVRVHMRLIWQLCLCLAGISKQSVSTEVWKYMTTSQCSLKASTIIQTVFTSTALEKPEDLTRHQVNRYLGIQMLTFHLFFFL